MTSTEMIIVEAGTTAAATITTLVMVTTKALALQQFRLMPTTSGEGIVPITPLGG